MTKDKFLEIMDDIDDKLIEDYLSTLTKRRFSVREFAIPAAAVLCAVVIGALVTVKLRLNDAALPNNSGAALEEPLDDSQSSNALETPGAIYIDGESFTLVGTPHPKQTLKDFNYEYIYQKTKEGLSSNNDLINALGGVKDSELAETYYRAMALSNALPNHNLTEWDIEDGEPAYIESSSGGTFWERNVTYDSFYKALQEVFVKETIEPMIKPYIRSYDGRVWLAGASISKNTSIISTEYAIIKDTDDELVFDTIHYCYGYNEDGTIKDGYVKEYIRNRFIKTSEGWRVVDLAGFFGDRPLYDKPGASKIIDVENTDAVETAQNPDTNQPRTMIFPIEGGLISDLPESSGGYYGHKGVDITAPEGTPILAAESGTVVSAEYGFNSGRGNYVEVKGDSCLTTIYEHCRELFVNEGEKVNAGDIVGYVGSTGYASGNHLHFEVRKDEEILNPMDFLPELNPSDFQQSDNLD